MTELYTVSTVAAAQTVRASNYPALAETAVVKSGEGVLAEGQVVGRVLTATAAAATNTGDGAISAVTLGAHAQLGVYTLICIAAATNLGTFAVYAPDGSRLRDLTVGTAYADQIGLTVADGSADWIVGDDITVTVADSGKWRAYDADNTDGSQAPAGILAVGVDATSADASGSVYVAGHFKASLLTGYSAAIKAGLRALGIHVS